MRALARRLARITKINSADASVGTTGNVSPTWRGPVTEIQKYTLRPAKERERALQKKMKKKKKKK